MQDKIPDALIAAFERHYAFPWDEPTLRNERLAWRTAWAEATKPCLLKIQEPATPQAAPAAVAVPDERAAFERELIDNHHYVPSDFSFKDGFYGGDDDYIQFGWDVWKARAALVATPAAEPGKLGDDMHIRCRKCGEQATVELNSARIVTHNLRTGKPRDARDIASDPEGKLIVAPGPLVAAPAAAAPLLDFLPFSARSAIAARHGMKVTAEFNALVREVIAGYRARAVPSDFAAAAPVVLPEPDFWVRPGATIHPDRGWQCWSNDGTATGAFHADTVRALLAGVSAPAGSESNTLRDLLNRRPAVNAGLVEEYTYWNSECYRVMGANAATPANDAVPQAQADALDPQLLAFAVSEIRRDEMEHAPVLYVSKEQLDNFRDPDGPDSTAQGRYLPARVRPSGKFTTPLFAAPQAQADARDAIRELIAKHRAELEHNDYAYFELAYTRRTGWMAWITDKPLNGGPVINPDRTVLARGQGDTPEEACAAAIAAQAAQQGGDKQ